MPASKIKVQCAGNTPNTLILANRPVLFDCLYILEDVFVHHVLQSSVFNYAYGGKSYSLI